MAELLPVPEVAAGATEVVISEWLVKQGDHVAARTPVALIETDKAAVEVEAEAEATLLRILAGAGSHVEVGAPMALLGTAAEVGSDTDALLTALGVTAAAGSPASCRSGATAALHLTTRSQDAQGSRPVRRRHRRNRAQRPHPARRRAGRDRRRPPTGPGPAGRNGRNGPRRARDRRPGQRSHEPGPVDRDPALTPAPRDRQPPDAK